MSETKPARVTIEGDERDDEPFFVIITILGASVPRVRWGRYDTRALAQQGADAARSYYRDTERGVVEAALSEPVQGEQT
jgi:hypothetical protein